MKIVIIGVQGNLGTQLAKTFSNDEVVGFDRQNFDFLDFSLLTNYLEEEKPELIINAAAYNAVDKCEADKEEKKIAKNLNIDLPNFLSVFCLANEITLVHYSTDYVFSGKNKDDFFVESDCQNPVNIYGQTKAEGEKKILELEKSGLKYYLIRTSKLFGPAGGSAFSKTSFFDMILKLAQNGSDLKAVNEENSCFTYTPDLAAATLELIKEKSSYGVYHLINEEAATWFDGASEALRIKGLSLPIIPVSSQAFPRPAQRPFSSVLKNTKRPKLRSWKEALADYLK